ncbi:hypothetical protein CPB86DRAFT_798555 [Serendipita vermifera]|nr:hypothetical protein CPB86DRAFT_798555 [Serendipita vermifera]
MYLIIKSASFLRDSFPHRNARHSRPDFAYSSKVAVSFGVRKRDYLLKKILKAGSSQNCFGLTTRYLISCVSVDVWFTKALTHIYAGYWSTGSQVTFVATTKESSLPTTDPEYRRPIPLRSFNLNDGSDRVQCVIMIIKICQVLLWLANVLDLLHPPEPEEATNTDRLISAHREARCVVLGPQGDEKLPETSQDVCNGVVCVLEVLKILHSDPNPIYHRDIRWPNMMKSRTEDRKWFLIDWEDSSTCPTRAVPHLSPEDHHPRVFFDGHDAEVDLLGVGKLLSSQENKYCPGDGRPIMELSAELVAGRIKSATITLEKIQVHGLNAEFDGSSL